MSFLGYGSLLQKNDFLASCEASGASATVPKRKLRFRLYSLLLMVDCLCIALSFGLVGLLWGTRWLSLEGVNLTAMIVPIYLGVAVNRRAYSREAIEAPSQSAAHAVLSIMFTMLAVQCVLYFSHVSDSISRVGLTLGVILSAVSLAAVRYPFSRYARGVMHDQLTDEVVLLDGFHPHLDKHVHVVDAQASGISADLNDPYMLNRIGSWLAAFDKVIVACPPERRSAWSIVLQGAGIQGEFLIPDLIGANVIGLGRIGRYDTHIVSRGPLSMSSRFQKRLLDLCLTLPVLIFLAPFLAIVALAIKIDSPGPVLFTQFRVGRGNQLFKIKKFRSMYVQSADSVGATSASREDARITRVGRILRRTSIDELPQLFNVLSGEMSIVGPRPHALGSTADSKLFWEVDEHYWRRHALKPGITGLAQIRGFRGATECEADLQNRLRADLEYLSNWSLLREFTIIVKTFAVLMHRNAY
jgi:polysaccharide biosynthesis protein PslA